MSPMLTKPSAGFSGNPTVAEFINFQHITKYADQVFDPAELRISKPGKLLNLSFFYFFSCSVLSLQEQLSSSSSKNYQVVKKAPT